MLGVLMVAAGVRAVCVPDPKLGLFSPLMLRLSGSACFFLSALTVLFAVYGPYSKAKTLNALFPVSLFVLLGLRAFRLARLRNED